MNYVIYKNRKAQAQKMQLEQVYHIYITMLVTNCLHVQKCNAIKICSYFILDYFSRSMPTYHIQFMSTIALFLAIWLCLLQGGSEKEK